MKTVMEDQSPFILMLALYGTWQLVGRLARLLLRKPLRPRRATHLLPRPDYSVRRTAEKFYDQHRYIRRMEKQG